MHRCSPAAFLSLCLVLLACGGGQGEGQCQHNFDCPKGLGCVSGACTVVHCTLDAQCDLGFICNAALKSCAECSNSTQCAEKMRTPVCDDTGSGTCVACNVNFDCTKALGSGHSCEAHACQPGCKSTSDCNASLGETCDTTVTPGTCIQCKTSSDCAAQGPAASACDDTGHCVQCFGTTPAAANASCGTGAPECNPASKTCVACLPANNATGQDCGYPHGGLLDPHDATTCNPSTYSCQNGCQFDAQCGCPRTANGGTTESACARFPDQEHCDPNRTTMAGVTGTTLGACVQCTANTHCAYKIHGTTLYGGAYAAFNGARCATDSCVEGCDADADCWPDHATTNGKLCQLGAPGDAKNHKCVECRCELAGADPAYCELNLDNTRACSNSPGGKPRVCDASTLSCRLKRQGEWCDDNLQCGAPAPGSTCLALGSQGGVPDSGFCTISRNADIGNPTLYCSPTKGTKGRCADFYGACSCQPGSVHASARSTNGANNVCVPGTCTYQ